MCTLKNGKVIIIETVCSSFILLLTFYMISDLLFAVGDFLQLFALEVVFV